MAASGTVQANPITIVLVSPIGEGKSTTGNTLCGSRQFETKTSAGFQLKTRACSHCDFVSEEGKYYRIIDTPGLQDTNLNEAEELRQRIATFADKAPSGVDAFLYLVGGRRKFGPSNEEAFNTFREACSANALTHTIMVVTSMKRLLDDDNDDDDDDDDYDDDNQETFFNKCIEEAQQIPAMLRCIDQVNRCVVGVENQSGRNLRAKGRKRILDMVEKVRRANNNQRYSNEHLLQAEMWRASIRQEAQLLENEANRVDLMEELHACFDGRRTRAQVEDKLQKLKAAEQEIRDLKKNAADATQKAEEEWQRTCQAKEAQDRAEQQTKEAESQLENERKRAQELEQQIREAELQREKERKRARSNMPTFHDVYTGVGRIHSALDRHGTGRIKLQDFMRTYSKATGSVWCGVSCGFGPTHDIDDTFVWFAQHLASGGATAMAMAGDDASAEVVARLRTDASFTSPSNLAEADAVIGRMMNEI